MKGMDITAETWLGLPDHKAFEIFTGPTGSMRKLYRRLVQHWHPDRNADPRAAEVLIRIQKLYRLASVGSGPSTTVSDVSIELPDNTGRRFHYQANAGIPFELGTMYRSRASFAYHIQSTHQGLFERFIKQAGGLEYASAEMRTALAPLLPNIAGQVWGPEGGLVVIRRPRGFVRLADLFEFCRLRNPSCPVPAEHVAWILSGLLNLACYLAYRGVAHNAIGIEAVWVNPTTHEVALPGGWFYAHTFGTSLDFLPAASLTVASSRFLAEKTATPHFDLDLIRAVGRTLLGDATGARLISLGHPLDMVNFLLSASTVSAVEDYRTWKEVLLASFGPPRFVPMNITSNDIYKENDNG